MPIKGWTKFTTHLPVSHNVIQSIVTSKELNMELLSEIKTDVEGQIPSPIKHIIFLKWSQLPSI